MAKNVNRKRKGLQITSHNSTIIFNIINFIFPIKGHGEWIKKVNPSFCCPQEANCSFKDKDHLKVDGKNQSKQIGIKHIGPS